MKIEQIAVVPGATQVTNVSNRGAVNIPIWEADRSDDFAELLSARLGVNARVYEGAGPMPGAGTLVVGRCDVVWELSQAGADMSWVVGLGLSRGRVISEILRLGLIAAVEILDFNQWVAGTPPTGKVIYDGRLDVGGAIYGRVDVGASIGAVISTKLEHSGRGYARLHHPDFTDLPSLLAAYLRAC